MTDPSRPKRLFGFRQTKSGFGLCYVVICIIAAVNSHGIAALDTLRAPAAVLNVGTAGLQLAAY